MKNIEITIERITKESNYQNGKTPYETELIVEVIRAHYCLDLYRLELKKSKICHWAGAVFALKTEFGYHLFCGGRFGHMPIRKYKNGSDILDFTEVLSKKIEDFGAVTASLSLALGEKVVGKMNQWDIREKTYLIADMEKCVQDNRLIFDAAMKRSNLSRAIKRGHQSDIICRNIKSLSEFDSWYQNCHLQRVTELNGTAWEKQLLNKLINTKCANLVIAERNGEILGGCLYLMSDKTLELFMMSTPQQNLTYGTNYLLTEWLYKKASDLKNSEVNWQGSNPPTGGIYLFKKQWNAKEIGFSILNWKRKNFDNSSLKFRVKNDLYIYPH